MRDAFTLTVPTDAPYRALVPEIAGRYAELSGGSSADAKALSAAVTAAVERVVGDAGPDAQLGLAFRPEGASVHVDLSCDDRRETLDVTIPVVER